MIPLMLKADPERVSELRTEAANRAWALSKDEARARHQDLTATLAANARTRAAAEKRIYEWETRLEAFRKAASDAEAEFATERRRTCARPRSFLEEWQHRGRLEDPVKAAQDAVEEIQDGTFPELELRRKPRPGLAGRLGFTTDEAARANLPRLARAGVAYEKARAALAKAEARFTDGMQAEALAQIRVCDELYRTASIEKDALVRVHGSLRDTPQTDPTTGTTSAPDSSLKPKSRDRGGMDF